MKLTYLFHSGFVLELKDTILIFDCYSDPATVLSQISIQDRSIVFFVSHEHGDHYSSKIIHYSEKYGDAVTYVVDRETVIHFHLHEKIKKSRLIVTEEGMIIGESDLELPGLKELLVYASNDAGVAYLLSTTEGVIYHAGDLNNWDWQDGEAEWMERFYRVRLKTMASNLTERQIDQIKVAMVPVDERLQNRAYGGADMFCRYLKTEFMIPMHLNGGDQLPCYLAERYGVPCYQSTDCLEILKTENVVTRMPSRELTRKPRHIPKAVVSMTKPGEWLTID
ncbi:MAG: MBL fold metallo-hydrolase [Fastidiosipilaceae bacterium]|jgi:L-ascorbate metabolism protein UlaG (beta-lactamase superfamily)